MNSYRFLAGLGLAAVLSCASPVHAQVLGGNVNGAVGGTLSGGTHGVDAMTRGSMNGSIGADAHGAGRIRDRASGVTEGVKQRTRATVDNTRAGVESKVEQAQDTSASVATRAAVTTSGTADAAANSAGAAANSAVDAAGSAKGSADSAVATAGSTAGSVQSQGKLENAAQADLRSDGPSTSAAASQDTQAKGGVKTKRMDVEADAEASSSVEASATTQR